MFDATSVDPLDSTTGDAGVDGGGIYLGDGTDAGSIYFRYDAANNYWETNSTINATVTGGSGTATTWDNPVTFEFTGDVESGPSGVASADIDGDEGTVTFDLQVIDDSHNHTTSTITDFTEAVQDVVGTMFTTVDDSSNDGIVVTYTDGAGNDTIALAHADTSDQANFDTATDPVGIVN